MRPEESDSFAALLRRARLAAGMTQEALAERAGLSARGLQDLERGVRQPQSETVQRLAAAFGLTDAERAAFTRSGAARPRHRQAAPRPASAGDTSRHNLPLQLTSFIGRELELAETKKALERSRLVTLTGTGGCGKTRLAVQAAAALVERYPDGVWLVELAPLADATMVPALLASVLGVRAQPGQPLVMTLVNALRPKNLLVLLDNCEHLLDACARLADVLLHACPDLRILATSRQALGIAGEVSRRVPSLAVPADDSLSVDQVLACDAVRLFSERALAVQPGFTVTTRNVRALVQICRRLGGIPLALELAAVRTGALGMDQLAARLDQRFRLLSGGNRTALPRQQTLQATINWSYDLLDARERHLFARLSVFAGGWTLEAAEAACSGEPIGSDEVPGLLAQLVDKSVVTAEERQDGTVRYRLLETLRQYGREKLLASEKADAVAGLHAAYYQQMAEETAPQLRGPRQTFWQRRLEEDVDNLRAALRWRLEGGDAEAGLRMALALNWFWAVRGSLVERRQWLSGLLTLPSTSASASLRAAALCWLATSSRLEGDVAMSEAQLREALALQREVGDTAGAAQSLGMLADGAVVRGAYGEAVRLAEEGLALLDPPARPSYDIVHWLGRSEIEHFLGRALTCSGDHGRARLCLDGALRAALHQGDQRLTAHTQEFLGDLASAEGDQLAARAWYEAALARYEELSDQEGTSSVHPALGRLTQDAGDHGEARWRFRTGLTTATSGGFRVALCASLEGLAALEAEENRPMRALRLAGSAAALRGAAAAAPHERAWLEARLVTARQAVGERCAMEAGTDGQTMTLEQTVAYALEARGDG